MIRIIEQYQEDWNGMMEFTRRTDRLWTDHFLYTRNTIISVLGSLGDVDTIVERLMRNQEDIGALMDGYFDPSEIKDFVDMLKSHIRIAGELVTAVKANADTVDIRARWAENGFNITRWMSDHDQQHWSRLRTQPLWDAHLNLTYDEMTTRAASSWVEDVSASDRGMDCIWEWSQLFSQGIIYQNMGKFSLR